jgi:3'(2'), 5'-bisphosphate nucleotidase
MDIIKAVRLAGETVMDIYNKDFSVEYKDDSSPVTQADLRSNDILIDCLKKTGYGILSEETGHTGSKEVFWVIDPLDGTTDFIQKTGEFSIMVGLVRGKKPVLGIVYAPAINKLYYAQKGKGAFLNDKRIYISNQKEQRMVISRNHFREKDKAIAKRIGVKEFLKMGSVGVKYGMIAEGKAEVCIYTTDKLGLWDCCAPQIILIEAGGQVFDTQGKIPQYNPDIRNMQKGFIGCNKGRENILNAI